MSMIKYYNKDIKLHLPENKFEPAQFYVGQLEELKNDTSILIPEYVNYFMFFRVQDVLHILQTQDYDKDYISFTKFGKSHSYTLWYKKDIPLKNLNTPTLKLLNEGEDVNWPKYYLHLYPFLQGQRTTKNKLEITLDVVQYCIVANSQIELLGKAIFFQVANEDDKIIYKGKNLPNIYGKTIFITYEFSYPIPYPLTKIALFKDKKQFLLPIKSFIINDANIGTLQLDL